MKIPKFNFVPVRQLNSEAQAVTQFNVSIGKSGSMLFKEEDVDIYDIENKFISFFADTEKRAIGWKFIEGSTSLDELSDCKQYKKNTNGNITVGITKLLKLFTDEKKSYYKIPVQKYTSTLHEGDIYYIIIPENESKVPFTSPI